MRTPLILLLLAAPLAACTPMDATFGGAAKHNMASQTVDPDPKYDDDIFEGGDGTRAAAAAQRYQKGEIKAPASTSTNSGVRGGGAGAGAGPN